MDASDPQAQTTNVSAFDPSNASADAFSNAAPDDSNALWPQAPVQLARGRQPRDALAKIIPYSVASMDEFEVALREYLNAPPEQPEHTEAQLSFWIGTSFMVLAPSPPGPPSTTSQQQQQQQHQQQPQQPQHPAPHLAQQHSHAPPGYQPANGFQAQYGAYQAIADPAMALTLPPHFRQSSISNGGSSSSSSSSKKPEHKVSLSIMEALQPTADPKDKMRKQRAIAKCCVDAIQRIDGYRYSFHNCWNSREDDSYRFSYYCNDSLLNKDRAANGKGAKLGKRATKPVYDCKGVLSVKFSATKETLDVFYRHVPVHKTYEERAPPPRKDSKRRKFLEENDPEALQRMINRSKDDSVEPLPRPPKKAKKPPKLDLPRPSNTSLESDLRAQSLQSLLLLIRDDPSAPPGPSPPEPEPLVQQSIVTLQSPSQPPHSQAAQQQPVKRRPRNSCDVCKAKKTKCDGVRPVCQTCVDKKRHCIYSDLPPNDDRRQSFVASEPTRQARAPSNELSELEKMKKELEEAKARIQQLEHEKRASTTPVQALHTATRPPSQPQPPQQSHSQPQQRPSISHTQSQPHTQQSQQQQQQVQQQQQHRQQVSQNHRQQLAQLNQVAQRRSPQQMAYNLDGQPVQQQQQHLQSPRQLSQTAQQQLQAAAQAMPMQAQQSFFTATNHTPYSALNRSMTQGSISSQSSQNPLSAQTSLSSTAGLGQPQQQTQLHNSGNLASGGSVDASSLYGSVGRSDLAWSPAAYYGYQSAQQQQQQDQWAARGSNVFR